MKRGIVIIVLVLILGGILWYYLRMDGMREKPMRRGQNGSDNGSGSGSGLTPDQVETFRYLCGAAYGRVAVESEGYNCSDLAQEYGW